jgi:general stress protein CsbA
MDRYGGPQTPLTIALLRILFSVIIFHRYGGLQTALTIALLVVSTEPLY